MTWSASVKRGGDETGIVLPNRTAPPAPEVAPPPQVPAHVGAIGPLTFVLQTVWSGPEGSHRAVQNVIRTSGRVRLAIDGGRREWLFVRNSVFPDRATGYLTDHDRREIRVYDDTPLRDVLGIRGWRDVLTCRFDPGVIASLADSGERRQAAGAVFTRYMARSGETTKGSRVLEVWWSESLLLPLTVTAREAGTTVTSTITNIAAAADASLLEEPIFRFRGYRLADAGEQSGH
jgi:hypothetical protein